MRDKKGRFIKDNNEWNGRRHTQKSKIKMSISKKGKHYSLNTEFKKGMIPWNKGKIYPQVLNNQNGFKKGKPPWNKNLRGYLSKNKNPNWKGGITKFHQKFYGLIETREWRKKVFEKDNFICQNCGLTHCYLEAHHIKPLNIIIQEFLNKYNQFSLFDDEDILLRLAISYYPFWDIDNGETLCKNCHKEKRRFKINENIINR